MVNALIAAATISSFDFKLERAKYDFLMASKEAALLEYNNRLQDEYDKITKKLKKKDKDIGTINEFKNADTEESLSNESENGVPYIDDDNYQEYVMSDEYSTDYAYSDDSNYSTEHKTSIKGITDKERKEHDSIDPFTPTKDSDDAVNEAFAGLRNSINNLTTAIYRFNTRLHDPSRSRISPLITPVTSGDALIQGERVESNYHGAVIEITGTNRDNLERLVMGEAGDQGYVGAALVAQTIHDTMLEDEEYDVLTIKRVHKYTGQLRWKPNKDVKEAVKYIFDEGGIAVKHHLNYFYAPDLVQSPWHETQKFIVEYKGHRFFSKW